MSGQPAPRRQVGFTLIEILVVIALLAMLMAMLFPVFAQAREKGRSAVCISNLRQIGQAMAMYAQDYDGLCPHGADPIVKYADKMRVAPALKPMIKDLPLLSDVLNPYVKEKRVWMCPDDFGFDQLEQIPGNDANPLKINAHPTAYEAFGSSYAYRTDMAFGQVLYGGNGHNQNREVGPANIIYLMDLCGGWHSGHTSGLEMRYFRYCALYGDGHAKSINAAQWIQGWLDVDSLDSQVPDPPDPFE